MLCLHGLVLKLTCELGILDDCQFCCAYQLVFVHVEHFHLDSPDLQEHLLPQIVDLMDFILLN